jgi:predicted amidophosphoribosyltransferase
MWRSVQDEAEFTRIREWILAQGTRKFLRNCLDLSVALDYNIANLENGQYTEIGDLEHRAKSICDTEAVAGLSSVCVEAIQNLPYYRDAELIVAVPPMSAKKYDLPSQVAAKISVDLKKKNLTDCFAWDHSKQKPLKGARIEEKWALLEPTGLRLNCPISNKSDVILIDDKYQSGTTMQFVAMKLQEAGARYIFGISLVKTLRDTDNAS